jgi:Fe-S-cluster containining protein
MDIPRFVPSEVCLVCDGCCRFAAADSVWSPLFLFEEIRSLTERNKLPSCAFARAGTQSGTAARIDLVCDEQGFFCPCLGKDRHACTIYAERPFECRLYPFLLVRDKGQRALALDEHCPYALKMDGGFEMESHVKALQEALFSPPGQTFLEAHPELFQEYPTSFKIVARVPF